MFVYANTTTTNEKTKINTSFSLHSKPVARAKKKRKSNLPKYNSKSARPTGLGNCRKVKTDYATSSHARKLYVVSVVDAISEPATGSTRQEMNAR